MYIIGSMLSRIAKFIGYDPMRKIFATIFAFALWIYVAIGNSYTYQREIKIVYVNLPDSLIVVDSVSSMNVTFSGRGGALFTIWAAPPKAQCDLRQAAASQVMISSRDLRIPVAYGPLRIDYETPVIALSIDQRIEREITVEVPIKDMPKQGFAIDEVRVLDTIRLSGPQRILEQMNEVYTESLSVRNRNATFEKDLKLDLPSSLLMTSQRSIKAIIEIEQTVIKTIPDIPLTLIYLPDQRVRSEKTSLDTLIIEGTRDRVTDLTTRDIEVRIKVSKLAPGDYHLPAEIVLPRYIKPVKSVPQKFQLTVY
jgi:YbbR domain-containing protein